MEGPRVHLLDSIEEHSRASTMGMNAEHTFYLVRVRKSRDEAELAISNPIFETRLDRSKGGRLGLKLDIHASTHSLYIKEIIGGLAFVWNSANPDDKMRVGDRIIRVNKVEGDAYALMEECKQNQVLDLGIHRGSAVSVTAGLSATCKQAFDNLKPGFTGTVTKVDEEGDALMKIGGIGNQWVCKTDYDKFTFEDIDRFYLKRFSDFRDLYTILQAKIDAGTAEAVTSLPELPVEERFGFRRRLSAMGASNFMKDRRDGLQRYLEAIFVQIPRIEAEPAVAEFFGTELVPDVDAAMKEVLRQRLEVLTARHRESDQQGS